MHSTKRYVIASMIAAALMTLGCKSKPPLNVTGTLMVAPNVSATTATPFELPEAKMTLADSKGKVLSEYTTTLDGKFMLVAPTPGLYSLCWDVQGRQNCRREVSIQNEYTALGAIVARFEGAQIYGRVLTGNARPCWIRDPYFSLDAFTTIDVNDFQNVPAGPQTRANIDGYYFFLIDKPNRLNVIANCEKATQTTTVGAGSTVTLANITLPNRAPRLIETVTFANGRGVTQVEPTTPIVQLGRAIDPEGDTIEYLWRDDDGNTQTTGATPEQFARNAPKAGGLRSSYLIARDGRGGYTYKRFDVEVAPLTQQASGTVIDEVTGAPIVNARVELGTATATTTANGWFNITAPYDPSDRYVLNIRHQDYALWSQILERSTRSAVYELIRAQVTTPVIDGGFELVDTRSTGWCASPDSKRNPQRGTPIEYVDVDNNGKPTLSADYIQKITRPKDCRRQGATITLKGGSLVDAGGNVITGNVRAAIATLNPTRRPIAGDQRAIPSAGTEADLLSYGAVYAEFRDTSGNLLNLGPGQKARVTIPIPPDLVPTAKPSIAFWSYNETTGKWMPEGNATLQNTPQGPAYVGSTTHFSELNMDIATDPNQATCLRYKLDDSVKSWNSLNIKSTVTFGGGQTKVKETPYDGAEYNVIWRIPFGTSNPPNTVRIEVRGTFNNQVRTLVDTIINTDARPKMTGTDLWPPYPYAACGDAITLAPPAGVIPPATLDGSNRPYFLRGPGGAFEPAGDQNAIAVAYYNAIDPTNAKPNMSTWWQANGFDATTGDAGATGFRASYLNHNDLGFGRDMHCRKNGSNVACYVTNYGGPNQAGSNADDALSKNQNTRLATVAMEYDASISTVNQRVKFYVYGKYNNGQANLAGRLNSVDLDGFGEKFVPNLCLVCHGGPVYLSGAGTVGSRFREFDLPSFKYPPGGASWQFAQSVPPGAHPNAVAFGGLNQMVRDIAPNNTPTRTLIDAWYPSGFTTLPVKPNALAATWSGTADPNGYHDVYGASCRTCHVARDVTSNVFDDAADFSFTSYRVCGAANHRMPNAKITYDNFWLDSLRVQKYGLMQDPNVNCN